MIVLATIIDFDNRQGYRTRLMSSQRYRRFKTVTDRNRPHTVQGPLFDVHVAIDEVSDLLLDPNL